LLEGFTPNKKAVPHNWRTAFSSIYLIWHYPPQWTIGMTTTIIMLIIILIVLFFISTQMCGLYF